MLTQVMAGFHISNYIAKWYKAFMMIAQEHPDISTRVFHGQCAHFHQVNTYIALSHANAPVEKLPIISKLIR